MTEQQRIPDGHEIERKFLIKTLPQDLEQNPYSEIEQGYIMVAESGQEIRVRREKIEEEESYYQTIKGIGSTIRQEIEMVLSEEQFQILWPQTEGRRIKKRRYLIPQDGHEIHLDVYKNGLSGHATAEVEFPTVEEMEAFNAPEWFGEDVSTRREYKNQSLALYGLPTEKQQKKIESETQNPGKPTYSLEKGLAILHGLIVDKLAQTDKPIIVCIAGGSGAGKTTKITSMIKKFFAGQITPYEMDRRYRGATWMQEQAENGEEKNWDEPDALDFDGIVTDLQGLKDGRTIDVPIYDMALSEQNGWEKLSSKRIILVDGIFAGDPRISELADIKCFISVPLSVRMLRRLGRDRKRTELSLNEILDYFAEKVQPMHEKYIQPTMESSDLIIENEFNPAIEAERIGEDRSGLHPVQTKFETNISTRFLETIGAVPLGTTHQIDNYFDPDDRNMILTGEMMRIRREGHTWIFTYKGPEKKKEKEDRNYFSERPTLEFEITPATEKKFLNLFGNQRATIKKTRKLYELKGVVFALDNVRRVENGRTIYLGQFIEIRSNGNTPEEKIKEVLDLLGLDIRLGRKESYFEM